MKRSERLTGRGRYIFCNCFKYRNHIIIVVFKLPFCNSVFCSRIYNRKIQLVFISPHAYKQIENLIYNPVRLGCGFINFVYDQNRFKSERKRFFYNKFCLWHYTFLGVHKQQNAVNHFQYPLNFTSEITVPRGVYNINSVISPFNRRIFRKNCYPSFFFKIVTVHYPLAYFFS